MISIITISFNAETYIEHTVRSILSQSDGKFEFILVDGASKDGTVALVQRIVSEIKFPEERFICISEKDNGVYDAMNKGVLAAHGDFVLFMNGGDSFYAHDVISTFKRIIPLREADAYYGNTMMEFYEGRGIRHENEEWHQDWIMPFIHQSVIVKRKLLMEHPFNLSYRILADREFFYWMRKNGCAFHYENFIVSNYDAREGMSENNPYLIAIEGDRILGMDKKPFYWLRKLRWRCTKAPIQFIKDHAPRKWLNWYFLKKRKNIIWQEKY